MGGIGSMPGSGYNSTSTGFSQSRGAGEPAAPLQPRNNPHPTPPGPQQIGRPAPTLPGALQNDPGALLRAAQRGRVNMARQQQIPPQEATTQSSVRQREEQKTREIAERGKHPKPHEGVMVGHILARHPRVSNPAHIKFDILSDTALSNLVNHPTFGNSRYGKQVQSRAKGELEQREMARADLEEDLSPEALMPSYGDVVQALQEAVARIPNDPLLGGVPISQWKDDRGPY